MFQLYQETCSLLLAMQLLQYRPDLKFLHPETPLISESSLPQTKSVAKVQLALSRSMLSSLETTRLFQEDLKQTL